VQDGLARQLELCQHLVDDDALLLPRRMAGVEHVQEQIGLAHLLEGGAEGGDEVVWQLADEADRIGEQRVPVVAERDLARQRIEGGEEPVLYKDVLRARECPQDGRLPRVRIADERGAELVLSPRALDLALSLNVGKSLLQQLDAVTDQPTVGLELRFAGAPDADAAAELLEVGPHPRQPRHGVLELRELDLHLGLGAAGAGGKDVEDQLRPIDHPRVERVLDVLALRGGELVVEDDECRLELPNALA
jgi:hypothetical protein